jgi:hypothetical protein
LVVVYFCRNIVGSNCKVPGFKLRSGCSWSTYSKKDLLVPLIKLAENENPELTDRSRSSLKSASLFTKKAVKLYFD